MKHATLFALTLAMALVAAPVFAADAGQEEFAAMTAMASDVTPLSDEQLAKIEGGAHITEALDLLADAQAWATPGGRFNLAVAAALQNAAMLILDTQTIHSCGPGGAQPTC